ncbi:Maf family protein [Peptoniphilus equinus]|uniref:dTTP/UTP pyrophosphatase n=1 Tax=Peptoniphilus equinus TaxID=3016343 RepID=A0ABY7QVG3_9FIRM|nr:Maf family protein [Peptoniphilus equinus]WBW50766.1 Maf family protein [Peptoniphilus equinus]
MILASQSPRRRELLGKFLNVQCITSNYDERYDADFAPEVNVMSLAFAKAKSVALSHPRAIVIGADTIVYYGEKLGKPRTRDEARAMLEALSGTTHQVYSGVAILNLEKNIKHIFYSVTHVRFRELSKADIEWYLDTQEYKDKAGAYGIQGYGAALVHSIDGDFFNVVGLPIAKTLATLRDEFQVDCYEVSHG